LTNNGKAGFSVFFSATAGFSGCGHEQSVVFGVGAEAQADKIKVASAVLGHLQRSGLNMWLLIAEMVLALSLIIFIMWWTLRARVDHPVKKTEDKAITEQTETKDDSTKG
jgi:hypothetical protein